MNLINRYSNTDAIFYKRNPYKIAFKRDFNFLVTQEKMNDAMNNDKRNKFFVGYRRLGMSTWILSRAIYEASVKCNSKQIVIIPRRSHIPRYIDYTRLVIANSNLIQSTSVSEGSIYLKNNSVIIFKGVYSVSKHQSLRGINADNIFIDSIDIIKSYNDINSLLTNASITVAHNNGRVIVGLTSENKIDQNSFIYSRLVNCGFSINVMQNDQINRYTEVDELI